MAEPDRQSRSFRATPEDISAADAWIEELGRRWGMAERTAFAARLCVAEIAGNVLEHGAALADPARLDITLRRRESGVDIEISDSGRPFDPMAFADNPPPRTIESAQIGGLGLHLVKSYASDISYRHDGTCNHLVLHVPETV